MIDPHETLGADEVIALVKRPTQSCRPGAAGGIRIAGLEEHPQFERADGIGAPVKWLHRGMVFDRIDCGIRILNGAQRGSPASRQLSASSRIRNLVSALNMRCLAFTATSGSGIFRSAFIDGAMVRF